MAAKDGIINYFENNLHYYKTERGSYCYYHIGDGPPIILLHGSSETSRVFWREFISRFHERYSIYGLDLRGCGNSCRPMNGYSLGDQASDVRTFIEQLCLTEKPAILGHSTGGNIALEAVIRYPKIAKSIILYGTAITFGLMENLKELAREINPLLPLAIFPLFIPVLGRFLFALRSKATVRLVLNAFPVFINLSLLSEAILAESLNCSYGVVKTIWHCTVIANQSKDLPGISTPALFINGAGDGLITPIMGEFINKRMPQAKLVQIQEAAHLALIEQPEVFVNIVSKFLSEQDAKAKDIN